MQKIDIQILDYLSEYTLSVEQILDRDTSELVNKPCLAAPKDTILNSLNLLQARGLIKFSKSVPKLDHRVFSVRDPKEIEVSMTNAGGQVWEKYLNVNWSEYISIEVDLNKSSPHILKAISINEDLVKNIPLKMGINEHPSINRLSPWHCTYWKIFPSSFFIELEVTDSDLENMALGELNRKWKNDLVSHSL